MLALNLCGTAQVYEAVNGAVKLFAEAPFEDVKASNSSIVSYINLTSGYLLIDVPVSSFEFSRGMMMRQFNDYYLETDRFPKAEFFGRICGYDVNLAGQQEVNATGELTIHGVTKTVRYTGTLTIEDGKIELDSKFSIVISDFCVDSPMLLFHPIAETVDVTVSMDYYPTGS